MRVVIDTNCWFGILPEGAIYASVADKLIEANFNLLVSTEIIYEYQEIIGKRLKSISVTDFLAILEILPNVEKIDPSFRFDLIKADIDDNKFVDCAIVGQADLIVTDDGHFKALKKIPFPKVETIKLKDFVKLI